MTSINLVTSDNDFECLSVLQEHTQDVKMIMWHPTKEVIIHSLFFSDSNLNNGDGNFVYIGI